MPPEELPKFHDVIASGRAEFATEFASLPDGGACDAVFESVRQQVFGLIFSWLLGQPVKDTLCGTKVLARVTTKKSRPTRLLR